MRSNGIPYPGIFDIDQTIFLAGLPDDLADSRIVNVRYFRKEMMFDLEIQSAYQPGNDRVIRSEISGRFDLVYRPFVFELIGFYIGNRESRMFHRMRQLEYQAQHKNGNTRKNNEPDHPVRETQGIDRQGDEQKSMN